MRRAILGIVLAVCAATYRPSPAAAVPETRPGTMPAVKDEVTMPDDAMARAFADAVSKAQEKMREALKPKLEQRAAAYKTADDAFLPAAKTAFEGLREAGKKAEADALAAYDARIKEITKTGDLDGALAVKAKKAKFELYSQSQAERVQADFQKLAGLDSGDSFFGRAKGDEVFQIKQVRVIAFEKDINKFRTELAATFPPKNNVARAGIATSTSTHPGNEEVFATLGGNRKTDTWCIAWGDPHPGYMATWTKPVQGRFILIIGRPVQLGTNAWGNCKLQVNWLPLVDVADMGGGKILVIELDRVANIRSIKIEFGKSDGLQGMTGLEIHSEAKGALPK